MPVSSEEKVFFTQLIDRYVAVLPTQRSTGEVEKYQLDAAG